MSGLPAVITRYGYDNSWTACRYSNGDSGCVGSECFYGPLGNSAPQPHQIYNTSYAYVFNAGSTGGCGWAISNDPNQYVGSVQQWYPERYSNQTLGNSVTATNTY